MKTSKIAIVDYGVGNLHSLVRAFGFHGVEAVVTEEAAILDQADGIILPGVGSFAAGMRGLKLRGLEKKIKELAERDKPILGICLGAQIMLTEGHEFGIYPGLDIIRGKVVHFPVLDGGEKVPQVGWNKLSPPEPDKWRGTILDSLDPADHVYFVHSYILEPASADSRLALTTYGGHTFCSAIRQGNIYGCQFHPEKSGQVGLKIIFNFLRLVQADKK